MSKLLPILVASAFALSGVDALAADPPKDAQPAKKAEAAPQKPADVTPAAWAKMTDAEKAKAVEKSKVAGATPPKKEKKGGC